ncbi:MAG: mechanosensitive ion channel family protein [Gammaproteobacteria bacterium]|nr:mechanosensitive ion channel family protein [Gammaproteobacteria bacterium]
MIEQIGMFLVQHQVFSYLMLVALVLVMLMAKPLVAALTRDDIDDSHQQDRVNLLRGLSVLLVAVLAYFVLFDRGQGAPLAQSFAIRLLYILVVLYLSYLAAFLCNRFVKNRYGRPVQTGDSVRVSDTYASRALSIFASVFIGVIALISIVRIAGFSSLLEAGGVLGFVGVFLALTQGAWAPDIISGLIILNSKLLQEKDVIRLTDNGETILAIVFRTRAFHTELRNLVDNHRMMVRNSKIRDYTVHNLSRFASARGLRENLSFKIGYATDPTVIKSMFNDAFMAACDDADISLEAQYPLEIRVQDTGDHAVEWRIYYYTKDELALIKTRQLFREYVLEKSVEHGVDLSTPLTMELGGGAPNSIATAVAD